MRPFCLTLWACAAALAGCHSSDPVDNQANGNAIAAPDNHAVPDAVGAAPSEEAEANAAGPNAAVTIPAGLRGRWGLTPADCTSTRGDAKGLLTISGHDLRFYESTAVPGTDIQSHPTSINGHFNFTGEGQSWSNFVSLKVTGNKLVRTETTPAASFTYAKC